MKCTPQNTIVDASTVGGHPGQAERVADVIGDVLDLGQLVVVGEDHGVALAGQPTDVGRPGVAVPAGSGALAGR